jgi:DNA mismatch repair ATPase MutS
VEQLDILKSARGSGLLSIIDHTHTAMGKRLLRHQLLNPEVKQECIERLYTDTEDWMDAFEEYIPILKSYPDMDRLIKDITTNSQGGRGSACGLTRLCCVNTADMASRTAEHSAPSPAATQLTVGWG